MPKYVALFRSERATEYAAFPTAQQSAIKAAFRGTFVAALVSAFGSTLVSACCSSKRATNDPAIQQAVGGSDVAFVSPNDPTG
jgi:hypothetical protein